MLISRIGKNEIEVVIQRNDVKYLESAIESISQGITEMWRMMRLRDAIYSLTLHRLPSTSSLAKSKS